MIVAVGLVGCGSGATAWVGMPPGEHVHSLAVTERGLFLGLHGGLYRSDDGTAWELVGLDGQDAMVIASAAEPPMFVAGHELLGRSDDGGATFETLRPPDLPGLDIHAFSQAPTDGRVVYAFVVGYGLYASVDAADTWDQRAEMGIIPQDTFGLAIVGSGVEELIVVGPDSGVLRSDDGGRSFDRVLNVSAWAVAIDPAKPEQVWALTETGLSQSDDAGFTWRPTSNLDGVDGQPVALAIGPEEFWLATEEPRRLYRSNDGGSRWEWVAGA